MKTSFIAKIILTSTLAIAAAALVTVPFHSVAYDGAKGGAQQLMLQTITSPAVADVSAAMSCSKCKDKAISYNASGKASVKDIRTVSMHDCGGCSTAIGTTGAGKAKVQVASHGCTMAEQSASCCN